MSKQVRAAVIGTGGMARYAHLRVMLQQPDTTEIVVVCEPSDESYAAASVLFDEAGVAPPPNEPDLEKLLADYGERLDVALIITPHNLHYTQSVMCMEAGLDVLVEKPMVMNADEAERLIITRNRTGRLVVVAFNGSMSPNNRTAIKMMRNGEIGALQSIAATVWQNWSALTVGSWRQIPDISGGGFLFDTGAHMLNTVVDLAGEPFTEVSAFLDNCDRPVDINGVVMGRLKSGVLVTRLRRLGGLGVGCACVRHEGHAAVGCVGRTAGSAVRR